MITRLQLGTSRIEKLEPMMLKAFLDKRWIHFGDPGEKQELSLSNMIPFIRRWASNMRSRMKLRGIDVLAANFKAFYYNKGDTLPFDSDCLEFIHSEHFFEHLFLDESLSLL